MTMRYEGAATGLFNISSSPNVDAIGSNTQNNQDATLQFRPGNKIRPYTLEIAGAPVNTSDCSFEKVSISSKLGDFDYNLSRFLPNGTYTVRAYYEDDAETIVEGQITVDNYWDVIANPPSFINGEGSTNFSIITPSCPNKWTLEVAGCTFNGTGSGSVNWDGTCNGNQALPTTHVATLNITGLDLKTTQVKIQNRIVPTPSPTPTSTPTATATPPGGTTGGSTGGTTGSTSGSTTGSTTGSTSGSTTGGTTGSTSGSTTGSTTGSTSGSTNGPPPPEPTSTPDPECKFKPTGGKTCPLPEDSEESSTQAS